MHITTLRLDYYYVYILAYCLRLCLVTFLTLSGMKSFKLQIYVPNPKIEEKLLRKMLNFKKKKKQHTHKIKLKP